MTIVNASDARRQGEIAHLDAISRTRALTDPESRWLEYLIRRDGQVAAERSARAARAARQRQSEKVAA